MEAPKSAAEVNRLCAASGKVECDLIMKGGLTSGVVFPRTISTLAAEYRFRDIGGTSAGAIAAVMTAAAEFQRCDAVDKKRAITGFGEIYDLPLELKNLTRFFQPTPELAKLFNLLLRIASAKGSKLLATVDALLSSYGLLVLPAILPGLLLAAVYEKDGNGAGMVLGIVMALLVPMVVVILHIAYTLAVRLPRHHFGFCPGTAQGSNGKLVKPEQFALTEWMNSRIQKIAQLPEDEPLTAGHLKRHKIGLVTVTTDLSSKRPYQLPLKSEIHYFCEQEFSTLFPGVIVKYLKSRSGHWFDRDGKRFYRLPQEDNWPVLLIARMSLSFPILVQAIPLYRKDESLVEDQNLDDNLFRPCLFSDGGISSNFPIHFFDSLLPSRPTFGISLGAYDDKRAPQGVHVLFKKSSSDGDHNRDTPVFPPTGLVGFLMSIVNSAKDWQDTMQSQLHGYSERIVEIRLAPDEGGLNLDMDDTAIGALTDRGEQAGQLICKEFNFDDHCWRRTVTAMPRVSKALGKLSDNFTAKTGESYFDLIMEHKSPGFERMDGRRNERHRLADFVQQLARLGAISNEKPIYEATSDLSSLRVSASIDTNPPS